MNRKTWIAFALFVTPLAACTDVVPIEPGEGIATDNGWGTADPSGRQNPQGGDPSDDEGAGWETLDAAPGTDELNEGADGQGSTSGADGGSAGPEGGESGAAVCGDGACAPDEDCLVCPEDCGATCPPGTCGDGICDGDNTCETCPEDCGVCGEAACGNGACDWTETCATCPDDCECPQTVCGDDLCDEEESCESCAEDCGACPVECGDGACDPTETCESCEADCGECEGTCCDQLSCNIIFEECLMTDDGEGCFCDPIYETCQFVGDDCPVGYQQPDDYVCIDYGGQEGICRTECVGPSIGDPDPCVGQEWLCGALPGQSGYCVPSECSGYFDEDFSACGPDATCLPLVNGKNTCVPDGPDDEGDSCGVHNECAHGLLCIDNECAYGTCSADTNQVPCADGVSCLAWTVGVDELSVGNCAAECTVFLDDGCPEDEWCFPLANTPEEGPIDGYCVPSDGYAVEGVFCDLDPNSCVDGTICVQSPDEEKPTCEPLCSLSVALGEPGSCAPGRGCSPLFMVNELGQVVEVMDYGSCIPSCTPWTDPGLSGCGGDKWCQPMLFNSHAGECKGVFGELEEGDDCTEVGLQNSCGVGLFCLGTMTQLGMDGECHRLCDTDGGAGATCAENQLCDPISFNGANDKEFDIAVGVCQEDPSWVPDVDITYDAHVQPILEAKCGDCHTGSGVGGHDIGINYSDAPSAPAHAGCAGLNLAQCALVRIELGQMPAGAGCGGVVDDDAPNASLCITTSEFDTLTQWLATGMLEN